jgi:predicted nucleic acid-binding protein
MSGNKVFFDTNILLYTLSEDTAKADRAEEILGKGGVISVQVLNEFASVASRKHRMTYPEIREALDILRAVCKVVPLTVDIHEDGLAVAERYGLSVYDALIVAAALKAGCGVLYSEDMQDGQTIENRLVIRSPFISCGTALKP